MLLNIILLALLFLFVNAFITDPVTTTLPSPSGLLFGHADVTALLSSQQPIFLHDKYHGEFKLLSCYSFCCLSSYCFIKTASLHTGFVRDYVLLKNIIYPSGLGVGFIISHRNRFSYEGLCSFDNIIGSYNQLFIEKFTGSLLRACVFLINSR